MLSYPSGMSVSTCALRVLSDALRGHRRERATRWRKLSAGRQALLVLAHLRKGETYAELACGFGVGTSTVYRYLREGIGLLAALAPTLAQAIEVAAGKAYVILDGTLLRIDRVGMTAGADRPFYSGKHKCHGLNVQVLADPAGRLIWISPVLPGVRHDMGAAREHGLIDALNTAGIDTLGDTAYQGGGPAVRTPHRRRRLDPDTGHRALPPALDQPEGGQRRARPPAWTGRAGQRAAEELAGPAQDPHQPQPSRRARRRSSDPDARRCLIRLAKAQCIGALERSLGPSRPSSSWRRFHR